MAKSNIKNTTSISFERGTIIASVYGYDVYTKGSVIKTGKARDIDTGEEFEYTLPKSKWTYTDGTVYTIELPCKIRDFSVMRGEISAAIAAQCGRVVSPSTITRVECFGVLEQETIYTGYDKSEFMSCELL